MSRGISLEEMHLAYQFVDDRRKDPEDLPGPGMYEYPEKERKGFTIGQKSEQKIPHGPGPGQYEYNDKLGREDKGFTIPRRTR